MRKLIIYLNLIIVILLSLVLQGCSLNNGKENISQSPNSNITGKVDLKTTSKSDKQPDIQPVKSLDKILSLYWYPCHRNMSENSLYINKALGWKIEAIEGSSGMGKESYNIFRTINGGNTWIKICSELYIPFSNGMTFINETTGFISCTYPSDKHVYYVTHDSGATWTIKYLTGEGDRINAPAFFNLKDGLIIAPYINAVFVTHDSGETWISHNGTASDGNMSWKFNVQSSADSVNEIIGDVEINGVKWHTSDSGYNWEQN